MQQQNYKNHRMFYPLHHFVLLPLEIVAVVWFAVQALSTEAGEQKIWIGLTATAFLLLFTTLLLRQHYALGNQNRIVRLEMRLRYYELTQKRFNDVEHQLTFGQLASLRFASDAELVPLLERAIAEKLSPDDIKRAIKDWNGDFMRV